MPVALSGQGGGVEIEQALRLAGGVIGRADLIALTSRARVERALREGDLVIGARGRYFSPDADEAVQLAGVLRGVLCRESAAIQHGWPVKHVPDKPHVSVPQKRKVPARLRARVHLHRDTFGPNDLEGVTTAEVVTLSQCIRHLPWDAALAVADSALRAGFSPATLHALGVKMKGPGSVQGRRVAASASRKPATVFESVLRAIALDVPGLHVEPQVKIRGALRCQPDLVDARLGIVLEADSFEWHGNRSALRRDARRYDLLVSDGWVVLRFAWEDVMHDQEFVRRVLHDVVALVAERRHCRCCVHRLA